MLMKRILALFLALLLCIGTFSVPAFAEADEIQVATGNKVVVGDPESKDGGLTPKGCVKIRFYKMPSKLELGYWYRLQWKIWYRYGWYGRTEFILPPNNGVLEIKPYNGYYYLVPKATGSVKMTLRCDGKSTTKKFTVVLPKPKSVEVFGALSVRVGMTSQLEAKVYPALASQAVTFSSSNKKVAKVDKNGLLTALKAGATKITVKAKANSKAKATYTVTVYDDASSVTRRGIAIGECSGRFGTYDYASQVKGEQIATKADVNAMYKLLRKYGVSTRTLINPYTSTSALKAIRSAFAGADANDVSYLYVQAHGGVGDTNNVYFMAIGSNGSTNEEAFLTAPQLKAELDRVPGTKVIFLESCHSGSVIGKGAAGDGRQAMDAFINEFRSAPTPKAGELAQYKYYVLCSTTGKEYSWFYWNSKLMGYKNFTGGLFTHGLTKGAGWDMMRKKNVSPAANTNNDNLLSLAELYIYTYNSVETAKAEGQMNGFYLNKQYVQCYPANSSYAVFPIK